MPPRFAFWTILIDNKPTAFRAAKREELQPTFAQLKRTNTDVVMKWFARGRLWDDPEQAQWAGRNASGAQEKRGRDWRPGGSHRDPRAQFDRRQAKHSSGRPQPRDRPAPPRDHERRPIAQNASPPGPPHFGNKRPGARKPRAPWQRDRKSSGGRAREDRPWKGSAAGGSHDGSPSRHRTRRPWTSKRQHGGGPRPKPIAPADIRRRRRDDDSGGDDK